MVTDLQTHMALHIANRTQKLLERDRLIAAAPDTPVFYVWPRSDRAVLIFDPTRVSADRLLARRFLHDLQTALSGRRVVAVNTRGIFLQIGYWPEPPAPVLQGAPLDLAAQPEPLSVPIGQTRRGPLWVSLLDMDSVLIGGARRMGKTVLLHSWIQALVRGGACDLLLWDGKGGVEFGRYQGSPQVTVATDLPEALKRLHDQANARAVQFAEAGTPNLAAYNRRTDRTPLRPLVVVLDELAFLPDAAAQTLGELVARCGAFGVHPVVGVQRPDADTLSGVLRANLTTRIALRCATRGDSQIILGQGGAEKLPAVKGRLLLVWEGRLVEAQAYGVTLAAAETGAPAASWLGLTEREFQVIRAAHEELDGIFNVVKLPALTAESKGYVAALGQRLAARGLLTDIEQNARGHRIGRRVTPELARLAGLGDKAMLAD